jgi:L-alanine-DL-glutamate epimerase-like enolase superfamily enzyme
MSATATRPEVQAAVESVTVSAYTVPTDELESDGTAEWDSTPVVVVELRAGDRTGLGYTYAPAAAGKLVEEKLADVVTGRDALAVGEAWEAMASALRNAGRPGIGFMALSAVDQALWDLKARLLELPLVRALDAARDRVPVYGSGGFCSYSRERLREQLGGWAEQGIPRVKMKVSRAPDEDPARLDAVREAIGDGVELFVDANGALTRKQALRWAERFAGEWDVRWFEEPVRSDDLDGLHLLRDRGPAGMDIAAGEYGYVLHDFRELLEHRAVDCLQADVTRCGGITGLVRVSGLCDAWQIELSGHCAPAVSAHALCAALHLRHLEYFHTHVRLERMLFDGTLDPAGGELRPDPSRPGLGLELKHADAARFQVYGGE